MHKPIGLRDSPSGIIHEISLHRSPLNGEAIAFSTAQRPDIELPHALLAGIEDSFGAPRASLGIDQTIVFRSELGFELVGLFALIVHHDCDSDRRNRNDEKD